MYLVACYTNAEDEREYTREELEESFATDTDLQEGSCDTTPLSLSRFVTQGGGLLSLRIASARDQENVPLP